MDQTIYNKARRDKFLAVLDIPIALKNRANKLYRNSTCNENFKTLDSNSLQFSVYGTPVPSVSVAEIDSPYAGQVHKTTSFSRPSYSSLTLGCVIDNRFFNYWLLWNWLDLYNEASTGFFDTAITKPLTNSFRDYVTSFEIYGLDEYNNKVVRFAYNNVFITKLSEIEFDYKRTEEIGCTSTFVFDQMKVELLAPECK
jgi:hypothetical protein